MAAALHFLQVELGDKELSFTYDAPSAGLRGSSSFDPDSVLKSAQKVLDCLSPSKTNFLLENLERESKALTDKVLSSELTTALQEADPGSHLRIMLTPMLAWIPWELLWDGQQFLCQRFCMGRRFEQTPGEFDAACQRLKQPQTGRGALIALGDTRHLQPEEQKEGVSEILQNIFRVELLGKRKAEDLLQDLKDEYEVVHFIGHGTYKEGNAEEARSGWQCVDRILTAADIERVSSYKAFPLLIFANACDSAK